MKCYSSELRGQHFAFYYTIIKVQLRPFPIHVGLLHQPVSLVQTGVLTSTTPQTGNDMLPCCAGLAFCGPLQAN